MNSSAITGRRRSRCSMEDALTANNDDIQAILCANDNMANGAIQALTNKNLQGKVVVTGQDADLLGRQNIVKAFSR